MNKNPKIINAYPDENFALAIEFAGGEYGLFSFTDRYDIYPCMAHPMKLKSFNFTEDFIEWLPILKEEKNGYWSGKKIWSQGVRLTADQIYSGCEIVPFEKIKQRCFRVSYKNQAPTQRHPTHHVYGVYITPFDIFRAFAIGESIGGGHADEGGGWNLSLPELLARKDWKQYFTLAGCEWAIEVVEKNRNSARSAINELAAEVRRRAPFD